MPHCFFVTFEQASCANAVASRSEVVNVSPASNAPDQTAFRILVIPFPCGFHDTLHAVRVTTLLLNEFGRSSSLFSAFVFAFNCEVPSSVHLLASKLDSQLRSDYSPLIVERASPWAMFTGHCEFAINDSDLSEFKSAAHGHTGNCSERGVQGRPNVLVTVADAQILRFLSPCCLRAVAPKLSLSPSNGSVIYCDVPFPLQFSWLHHSELQPSAHSHRFNAGILEFKSPYLTTEATFSLQLLQKNTMGVLQCSHILPNAPLMLLLEGHFESYSIIDDVDGDNYTLFYTLATPCSMPHAQIPDRLRAALHDAAIFTWDESDGSTQPPQLQVSAPPFERLTFT
jgi:hypothetical protein